MKQLQSNVINQLHHREWDHSFLWPEFGWLPLESIYQERKCFAEFLCKTFSFANINHPGLINSNKANCPPFQLLSHYIFEQWMWINENSKYPKRSLQSINYGIYLYLAITFTHFTTFALLAYYSIANQSRLDDSHHTPLLWYPLFGEGKSKEKKTVMGSWCETMY